LHIITPHHPSHTLLCSQSLDLQINYPHPEVNEGTTCMLLDSICTAFFNSRYSTRLQVTRPCRQAHARRNYRETIPLCELYHIITGKWGHHERRFFMRRIFILFPLKKEFLGTRDSYRGAKNLTTQIQTAH
jgi:hypothetical protein